MRQLNPDWYPCGHPRTVENTLAYTVKGAPKRDCRTCANDRKALARARAKMKAPKPVKWISAPNLAEIIAEVRPRYLREIEPKKPTGRPRKVAA